MKRFVSGAYRPAEDAQNTPTRSIADIKIRKLHGRYAQTPDQFAAGPALMRRITGESLDFRPNADRYKKDAAGQYLLDLPA